MRRRDLLTLIGGGTLLSRAAFAETPALKFRELYARANELSEQALALQGQEIRMVGYMAPPLKPEVGFFVLTKLPMSVCPFCESTAQWPDDIVVAYADDPIDFVRYTDLIAVEGRLETGFWTDPETGFLSLVRMTGVSYARV